MNYIKPSRDKCGFFEDFTVCDDTIPPNPGHAQTCVSNVIWDGCEADSDKNKGWYCITRAVNPGYWCVTYEG